MLDSPAALPEGRTDKQVEGPAAPRILCEGWRFLPQSFAIVNQFQALALAEMGAAVTVRDLSYFGDWQPVTDLLPPPLEQKLAGLPRFDGIGPLSGVVRVALPFDFAARPGVPTLVMATADAGTIPEENILGGVSVADAVTSSSARIYAPSRWSRDGLVQSGIPPERIDVIGHGVDPTLWRPATAEERASAREDVGWADDFVLLSVGAMTENKGIDLLLQGFAVFLERHPQARLVLKGTDALFPSQDLVRGFLSDLPTAQQHAVAERLIYVGANYPFSDMVTLYQIADVYVSPYRAEGFNLPVLEAAACGLPVICTAGGATDDFTTGAYALPIDAEFDGGRRMLAPSVQSLIAQMQNCFDDEGWRRQAAIAGPALVAARHTWRHAADGLLRALAADAEAQSGGESVTEPAGEEPLRLHIGGKEPKPGWKILNIAPGDHVDFVGDCADLSQFEADTVDEIYASHVLEHLGYAEELPQALKEFHRVLKPGGVVKISVPDLETLCRVFLHPQADIHARFQVMRILFGGQTDPHDFHKSGLTYEFLRDYLSVAGFREIRRVESFGLFEDTSTLELGGVAVSVNVEAVK